MRIRTGVYLGIYIIIIYNYYDAFLKNGDTIFTFYFITTQTKLRRARAGL